MRPHEGGSVRGRNQNRSIHSDERVLAQLTAETPEKQNFGAVVRCVVFLYKGQR